MRTIKIFFASSVVEFEEERKELLAFQKRLNDLYKPKGIEFDFRMSEIFPNDLKADGSQAEYNIEIRNSRFVYFIIGKSVGKYTKIEFREAKDQFLKTRLPQIYTYFKYNFDSENVDDSVVTFVREDLCEKDEHYYTLFKHIDSIKVNIMAEIVRNLDVEAVMDFSDGFVTLNGEKTVPLKNIPLYNKNENLAALKAEYEELNTKYTEITAKLSERQDFSAISEAYEIGIKRNKLLEEINNREKKILENCLFYAEKTQYGSEINWRERKALEFYNEGNYAAGDAILNDELWENEIANAEEIECSVKKTIHEYISGKRTLISSLMTDSLNEKMVSQITKIYKRLADLSERYNTDLNVIYDYAKFLYDQKQFADSLEFSEMLYHRYISTDEAEKKEVVDLCMLLGEIYHMYKKLDEEEAVYNYALSFISNIQDNPIKYGRLKFLCGRLYHNPNGYEKAEKEYIDTIEILKNITTEEAQLLKSDIYSSLGRLYNAKNNVEEAINADCLAIKMISELYENKKSESVAETISKIYNNMGIIYLEKTNDFKSCKDCFEKALEIRESFVKKNPARWLNKFALIKSNLSRYFVEIGDYETALLHAEESYRIRSRLISGKDRAFDGGYVATCRRMARANKLLGNEEEALEYAKTAVEVSEKTFPFKPSYIDELCWSYLEYARCLEQTDTVKAEKYYKKTVRMSEQIPQIQFYGCHDYAALLEKFEDRSDESRMYYQMAYDNICTSLKNVPKFQSFKKELEGKLEM